MLPGQLDMLEWAKARRTDPDTSKQAAGKVNTTALEAAVFGALKAHGPQTINEVADVLRLSLVTVSPRFAPLRDKGLIKDSGVRRLGEAGRSRIVWEIVQ
jgi:predicted ArsR family transcriptional regulator